MERPRSYAGARPAINPINFASRDRVASESVEMFVKEEQKKNQRKKERDDEIRQRRKSQKETKDRGGEN